MQDSSPTMFRTELNLK